MNYSETQDFIAFAKANGLMKENVITVIEAYRTHLTQKINNKYGR